MTRPTDWIPTVCLVGSFKLLLPQFVHSLAVASDVEFEETLKCKPKTTREKDC